MTPETRYARSGDLRIAYQAGAGLPGWVVGRVLTRPSNARRESRREL